MENGNLDSAESKLLECLRLMPDRKSTKHNLAILFTLRADALCDLENYDEALVFYSKALKFDENYAIAWSNKGIVLNDHFNLVDKAISCFEKALQSIPNYADAKLNLGVAHAKKASYSKAIEHYESALKYDSNLVEAWSNRGVALNALKRHEEALASADKAITLKPDFAEAWSNRGNALNDLKRHEEALTSYERAIELKTDLAEALSNRGNALRDLRRYEEALASHERAIELKPDLAEAWSNRGNALRDLRRYEEALASHERAIELKPGYAEAWSNRGNALNDLKRHEEALAHHERSIELKPDYAEAWSNRGIALNDLKRYEDALASYERSIELKPDFAEAIFTKGLLELSQKSFLSGFENYRKRWKVNDFSSSHIRTTLPICSPKCSPENILLWAEQGLGDEIFYAGMLTQALDKFSSISLIADARLHPIFARSFPQIKLLDRGASKSMSFDLGFESQAPIGDLGHILTLSSAEIKDSREPYLIADPDKKSLLLLNEPFGGKKIVCGLAWRSVNENFGNQKSIDLIELEPILRIPEFEFINLQYGKVQSEIQKASDHIGINIQQIKDLDVYNDIESLLALIDACDIVITTSNLTAHLAGSIGKKGCVLVPFSIGKIWYWHLNDVSSLWYPSLRVFYQIDRFDWSTAIKQLQKWLERDFLRDR